MKEAFELARRNECGIIDKLMMDFLKKNKCKYIHKKDHLFLFLEGL